MQQRLVISGINRFTIPELINPHHRCQRDLCSIGVNGRARGKIQMQRFNFFVEDGFRDADRTVRDGLRQAAGNKRQFPPG
ncbi:hypothetical protein NUKP55_35360 [Klebsiella variicola]|nr:hypothetical protein NUKP55_35360 [Klebsiella variicola]